MKALTYKKTKSSVWGGNGVGNVPASWACFVDGEERFSLVGYANYSHKGYRLYDTKRNRLGYPFSTLKEAKQYIENNLVSKG